MIKREVKKLDFLALIINSTSNTQFELMTVILQALKTVTETKFDKILNIFIHELITTLL